MKIATRPIDRRATMFLFVLLSATFLVYRPSLSNGFVSWDDPETIRDNGTLRPPLLTHLHQIWTSPAGGLYVPVTYTFWLLIARLSAAGAVLPPLAFHVASLLLHMINVSLVFLLVLRLTGTALPALFGALIFAVHPAQVETVAWASGAKDLLAAAFALLMLNAYAAFAIKCKSFPLARHGLILLVFCLAVLSKPSAVSVVPIVMLIDRWLLHRPWKEILRSSAALVTLALPAIAVGRAIQPSFDETRVAWLLRPHIALDSLGFYLTKLVWPIHLTALYGRTPARALQAGWTGFAAIGAIAACVLALTIWHRRGKVVLGLIIFCVALTPTLGFVAFSFQIHSTVADHYLYLPMFGIALATAAMLGKKIELPTATIACVTGAILGGLSFRQTRAWHDSVSLLEQAVAYDPTSIDAKGSLATALAESGRVSEALPLYQVVVNAAPRSRIARERLTQALLINGNAADAEFHARQAVVCAARDGVNPAWDYYLLGCTLQALGRGQEAEKSFESAARLDPESRIFQQEMAEHGK